MSGRAEEEHLKRLGFLRSYATKAAGYAESAYSIARGLVPGFVEPYAAQAEDRAKAAVVPALTRGQDAATDLLAFADGKVDALLNALGAAADYSRDLHGRNVKSFSAARASYAGFVQGVVSAGRAAIDPQRYVEFSANLGATLVSTAAAYADPDKAVDTLTAALDRALSFGPMPKVVELADPLITVGQAQYARAHGALVAQPLYKRLYDAAASLPPALRSSGLFAAAYPLLAPVADPVVANFAASRTLAGLGGHLKPKAA
ncbi:MAG: hypothetical protein J3K34DRAFT_410717 [Monoraphidium minutum]|nr:MAG: hypothetical protein J3K34DRAFT_410717 [Monoraphidium minutum]